MRLLRVSERNSDMFWKRQSKCPHRTALESKRVRNWDGKVLISLYDDNSAKLFYNGALCENGKFISNSAIFPLEFYMSLIEEINSLRERVKNLETRSHITLTDGD
jgi:hypothetical protein